ncbi:gamma-glutamylcyclotransferase b isoform X2 [Electrophorus electricus]|uniref:Gamma-glutamylcyclotransferase n=1 Tax=Electrophorus electricus TaxID=8005 RepID=A0A4W4H4R5_ELEEL|nr:gamma-glutamylcyclotransferase b isoform X2 [Electrophorus electricus]
MALGKRYIFHSMLMTGLILLLMLEALGTMDHKTTFLYFAYGSNLLKERLQLNNPSASIQCVAKLQDYKLAFGNHKGRASRRWHGGVATIEPSPGDEVWGVVWMNMTDLESLDRQEGVKLGIYSPIVESVWASDQYLSCRTYIMNNCTHALPSPQYLKVMMMGAEQNELPKDYQEKLKAIETNKYDSSVSVMEKIEKSLKKKRKKPTDA